MTGQDAPVARRPAGTRRAVTRPGASLASGMAQFLSIEPEKRSICCSASSCVTP